jgi:hypothetical protein
MRPVPASCACEPIHLRLCSAAQRRCRQHRKLEFSLLLAAEGAFGQELLPYPFQGQGVGTAGFTPVQRVGGDVEKDLAGKGVVAGMQRRQFARQLEELGAPRQPVEEKLPGRARVLGAWAASWKAYPDGRAEAIPPARLQAVADPGDGPADNQHIAVQLTYG